MIERDVPGGQASHTSLIENFFGFPDGIGGAELARLAGPPGRALRRRARAAARRRRQPAATDGALCVELAGGGEIEAPRA